MTEISIDPNIFQWSGADTTHLLANKCSSCGVIQFPQQGSCLACGGEAVEQHELKRDGVLWSWTSQNYPPSSPPYKYDGSEFEPFMLGYVELQDQVRVQTKILATPEQVSIGMRLELAFMPAFTNDAGQTVMMYAFKPV